MVHFGFEDIYDYFIFNFCTEGSPIFFGVFMGSAPPCSRAGLWSGLDKSEQEKLKMLLSIDDEEQIGLKIDLLLSPWSQGF